MGNYKCRQPGCPICAPRKENTVNETTTTPAVDAQYALRSTFDNRRFMRYETVNGMYYGRTVSNLAEATLFPTQGAVLQAIARRARQESQKEFDGLEIVKVTWVNVPQYKVEAL